MTPTADATAAIDRSPPASQRAADRLLAFSVAVWILTTIAVRAYCAAHGSTLVTWDAGWYVDIAKHGYHFNGNITQNQPVAFLPAYPFVLRLLLATGLEAATATFLLSTLATLGGLALLHRALSRAVSPMASAWTCMLLVASPFSLYFLNGYSESLYFLVASAFWWAMLARRDEGAGALFAGLASLVRPFGIILAASWLVEVIVRARASRTPWTHVVARLAALGPLTLCGIVIVSLFYAARFDDLFLYRNIRVAWLMDVVRGMPGETLDRIVGQVRLLADWHPTIMLMSAPQFARVMLYGFLVLLPFVWKRMPRVLLVYGLGLVAFAIVVNEGALDIGRHLATNVAFVMSIVLLLGLDRADAQARPIRGCIAVAIASLGLSVQSYFLFLSFTQRWVS